MSDHAILVVLVAVNIFWSLAAFLAVFLFIRRVLPVWLSFVRGFNRALNLHDLLTWLLVGSVGALMFLPGCAAPGDGATQIVLDAWQRVSADGIVTKEEGVWFASVLSDALGAASSIDWPTTIVGLATSAVSAFLGVNVYRNSRERKVWGPPPPPAPAPTQTPTP